MRKTLWVLLTLLLALSVHELPAASSRDKVYLLKKKQDEKCRLSMMRIYEHLKAYHAKKKAFPKLNNYSGLKELVKNGALPGDFVCDAYRGKKNKKLKDMTEKTNPFLYFGGINYAEAQRVCPNIPLLCDKPNSRHLNVQLEILRFMRLKSTLMILPSANSTFK